MWVVQRTSITSCFGKLKSFRPFPKPPALLRFSQIFLGSSWGTFSSNKFIKDTTLIWLKNDNNFPFVLLLLEANSNSSLDFLMVMLSTYFNIWKWHLHALVSNTNYTLLLLPYWLWSRGLWFVHLELLLPIRIIIKGTTTLPKFIIEFCKGRLIALALVFGF